MDTSEDTNDDASRSTGPPSQDGDPLPPTTSDQVRTTTTARLPATTAGQVRPTTNGRLRTIMTGRVRAIAMIAIVDLAAPLVAYNALRSAGASTVTALLLSGVFPALSLVIGAIRHRRLEVVGALVLAGIVVGTVLGLAFHSARLLLVEGSVPTAVFGLGCLGSLWTPRPLMFGFAREFAGPDTATGQEMTRLWQYEGYRHVFRVITAVWGVALLVEAGLRVVVIYSTSTTTALLLSKIMTYGSIAILCAWTVGYGTQQKKKGERMAAAAVPGVPANAPGTQPK